MSSYHYFYRVAISNKEYLLCFFSAYCLRAEQKVNFLFITCLSYFMIVNFGLFYYSKYSFYLII